MKAKIIRLDPSVPLPKYQTKDSAAFDIQANADIVIEPGNIEKIPTGLVIEAPEGHFLMLANRSSTAAKLGLKMANGVGIVDRDYSGPNDEIFLPMHNFTEDVVYIQKGERVAQGTFVKIDQVEWEETKSIAEVDRGGYGSTGGYAAHRE